MRIVRAIKPWIIRLVGCRNRYFMLFGRAQENGKSLNNRQMKFGSIINCFLMKLSAMYQIVFFFPVFALAAPKIESGGRIGIEIGGPIITAPYFGILVLIMNILDLWDTHGNLIKLIYKISLGIISSFELIQVKPLHTQSFGFNGCGSKMAKVTQNMTLNLENKLTIDLNIMYFRLPEGKSWMRQQWNALR